VKPAKFIEEYVQRHHPLLEDICVSVPVYEHVKHIPHMYLEEAVKHLNACHDALITLINIDMIHTREAWKNLMSTPDASTLFREIKTRKAAKAAFKKVFQTKKPAYFNVKTMEKFDVNRKPADGSGTKAAEQDAGKDGRKGKSVL
jgi:hypothetical protein